MRLVVRNPPSSGPTPAPSSGAVTGEYHDPQSGEIFARELDASVGDDPKGWATRCAGVGRVILRSGSLSQVGDEDRDAPAWLASWSERGWADFDERVREAHQAAQEQGVELLIRPHAQGMLSDAVSTLSWCTRAGGLHQSLLLDPIAWLVPSMVPDAKDHLIRLCEICEALIEHQCVSCVLLRSFRQETGTNRLLPASLTRGQLDARLILDHLGALIEHAPALAVLDERDWALF